MKRTGIIILVFLVALPFVGALAGRLSAPALARLNTIVRVAEHVRQDELSPQKQDTNATAVTTAEKDVKSFRATGMPPASIYAQAREIQRQFATGSTWFGLWCGLVASLKITGELRLRRRREYEADSAHCLACARCYRACPVERERLEKELGERS